MLVLIIEGKVLQFKNEYEIKKFKSFFRKYKDSRMAFAAATVRRYYITEKDVRKIAKLRYYVR